ncbi:large conductance mechanosensitive channel protein MscL [Nesterenkonia halobia]|uniref:Large-conductance mechanosensitive channel n=1 Tax=Nesterenkonia halobia TaxID=37922 RepID=A0ABP6RGE9_9MICC
MLTGFRDFIMKGNVVDLAVAVVIGAAFGTVITALVEHVLMPLISALVGSPSFDDFAVVEINGNLLQFGMLLTALVNFLLVAAAVYFTVVLPMTRYREALERRRGDAAVEDVDPNLQVLHEIRDLLAEQRETGSSGSSGSSRDRS